MVPKNSDRLQNQYEAFRMRVAGERHVLVAQVGKQDRSK